MMGEHGKKCLEKGAGSMKNIKQKLLKIHTFSNLKVYSEIKFS